MQNYHSVGGKKVITEPLRADDADEFTLKSNLISSRGFCVNSLA